MKILFCALKYEYGRKELGLSAIEYQNFYQTLARMENVEAEFFAMDEIMQTVGRDEMNQRLIQRVKETKPDLLFCVLFTEEIKKQTIDYITKHTSTKTFNWFTDDHWRFFNFSKYWAPLFTAIGTTDSQAMAKYKSIGVNVIKTQWAANVNIYKPQNNNNDNDNYNITFVGKNYGKRGQYIAALQSAGLPAQGFGKGWPRGMVDFNKMLKIFSNSKINLNFTESSLDWRKEIAKLFFRRTFGKYSFDLHFWDNLQSLKGKLRRQIKGRTFEVPACGGFLMSADADNLRDYYIDGKEIVIFNNKDDLGEKCKYYLEHEEERKKIAQAGYERTVKEHTYEKRFKEIFRAMNLA